MGWLFLETVSWNEQIFLTLSGEDGNIEFL